jgi:Tfp pilus assembly protein PilW
MRGTAVMRRSDRGASLVELTVVIPIAAVLLAGVSATFVGMLGAVRAVTGTTSTVPDVRIAVEAVTRTLRVAYQPPGMPASQASALVTATPTAVSFYALLNRTGADSTTQPLPMLVEYAWDGRCLNEALTPARVLSSPPAGGPLYAWDTARRVTCLLRTTQPPSFTYYPRGAITVNGAAVASLPTPAAGLDLQTRKTVQSVQVALTGDVSSGGHRLPLLARVTLQNIVASS